MKTETIKSFQNFLDIIESVEKKGYEINLFRGQSSDDALLPSIARKTPDKDSRDVEKEMLNDLKRRSQLLMKRAFSNPWEWLVFAQHFGMKTRLLDWSSNPLAALWFACNQEYRMKNSSYVYCLSVDNDRLVDIEKDMSPFEITRTRVLRPSLNNERIIAQSGWFTAHAYSKKAKRFVKLETNADIKNNLLKITIPSTLKKELLRKLSIFGINNRTMYPDISGLCEHLNWKYDA